MEANASPEKAPLWRRILGSFLSVFVGWIVLMIYIQGTTKPNPEISVGDMIAEFWAGVGMIESLASITMFLTWLVGFLPLYLLIPLHSTLWRWPICTICGAFAGASLMLIISLALSSSGEPWADLVRPSIIAAGIGWITCLFASLTRHHFQYSTKKSP